MYDIKDEDYEGVVDQSRLSATKESSPLQTQLPVLELLKVCACSFLVLVTKHVFVIYECYSNK